MRAASARTFSKLSRARAWRCRIERYVRDWDEHATPFVWVKTADEILAKAVRKSKDHSGTDH
jgi:hypothetical protein